MRRPNATMAAVLDPTQYRLQALKLIDRPNPAWINGGLSPAKASTLMKLLGEPRPTGVIDQECRPITNPDLKRRMVTLDVGPFRVYGHEAFLALLQKGFAAIKKHDPQLYALLGHVGCQCCRYVRGSKTTLSNHSWGTAIDITLGGKLDGYGDGKTQQGLFGVYSRLYPLGIYWGAEFNTEDSMHFELSEQKVRELFG